MEIFINIMDRLVALLAELMKALGFTFATENNVISPWLYNPEFVAADNEATNVLNNE